MGRYARAIPVAALAAVVSAGAGLAASGPADGSGADRKRHHERAHRFAIRGLDPALITGHDGAVRVRISLQSNPLARASDALPLRSALAGRLGATAPKTLRRAPKAGARLAWHVARKRSAALGALHRAAAEAGRT